MPEYIPRQDEKAIEWLENFIAVLEKGRLQIGLLRLDDLRALLDAIKVLMFKAHSPESNTLIVHEKDEKLANLKAQVRSIVNYEANGPGVTDTIRLELGLPLHDNTRTTIGVPQSHVDYEVASLDFGRVRVDFWEHDSESKAKPYGTNGAVIAYSASAVPLTSIEQLTHTILATRTPHVLEFADADHGKTVYVSICWQNAKGQRGPWNVILSAIIP